jgi:hypothetical protein
MGFVDERKQNFGTQWRKDCYLWASRTGAKRLHFPKYGKMKEAVVGTEDIPFKILMSHDPSHWDGEVRPEYSRY